MNELKRKYARLALACGVNVQKGQTVMINADVQICIRMSRCCARYAHGRSTAGLII